ncbi:hypothetical protein E2C01_073283 [Portunus trituberculatus]|uniref:Uncharacterized protein n=1 Tax=Portunus trituberculatus TaxID=210409 RepID=A0A5B7IA62_PORTR|nr:hypothetical protein [Portunus trituberculatus]
MQEVGTVELAEIVAEEVVGLVRKIQGRKSSGVLERESGGVSRSDGAVKTSEKQEKGWRCWGL